MSRGDRATGTSQRIRRQHLGEALRGADCDLAVIERHVAYLSVADAMHRGVLSCISESPLADVARMMAEHRVNCVVVLGPGASAGGWGVLSDLDLVRAAATGMDVTAGQSAATEFVTSSPTDTLGQAARVMGEHDTSHLVVTDPASGEPTGILSTLDIALAGHAA